MSITSNIAEGFGRHDYKEKIQFFYTARGSLTELKNQISITRDIGYVEGKSLEEIIGQTVSVHKLLRGLIKKSRSFLLKES